MLIQAHFYEPHFLRASQYNDGASGQAEEVDEADNDDNSNNDDDDIRDDDEDDDDEDVDFPLNLVATQLAD